MAETIISEVKPKSRSKHIVVLIAGLAILGLAIKFSMPARFIEECDKMEENYSGSISFKFLLYDLMTGTERKEPLIFLFNKAYAQNLIDPVPCGGIYGHIFYLDLYLISLLMIGYGGRGLGKKNDFLT